MSCRRIVALALLALLVGLGCSGGAEEGSEPPAGASPGGSGSGAAEESGEPETLSFARARRPFFGDLGEIRERRFLRALVSYSKTTFFHDGPEARGFEVEMLRKYEGFLNQGVDDPYDKVRVVFIPTPFDRLLEELEAGRGDLAAAGLTLTAARREEAAFTAPYLTNIRELVVSGPDTPELDSLDDLAGRRVVVRAGSSYVGHLLALSERLEAAGREAIRVEEADPRLVTEDLLEMVNSGALELTVADSHIAGAWAEVLPAITVRQDLAIHTGGEISWAVRRGAPDLLASLDAFVAGHKKGSLLGNIFFKRYYGASKWVGNPLAADEAARLREHIALFQEYAGRYGIDWLALAAQAYQESGIDQGKRSGAGAVGVMQLLPSTAADKSVGIPDIEDLENNIHAGAKYLAFLRDRYFDDPAIEPAARLDFAWAAYNAGPARVRGLRRRAEERGLDPNRWFAHVEKIAAEEIGRETVDYVANINKYYLAYRLQFEAAQRREAVKSAV
jgi:membrane-bound lytic murein transglycosylase MltF